MAIQIHPIIKLQTEAKHIVEVVASLDLNPSSQMKTTLVFLLDAIKEVSNIQDTNIAYLSITVDKMEYTYFHFACAKLYNLQFAAVE